MPTCTLVRPRRCVGPIDLVFTRPDFRLSPLQPTGNLCGYILSRPSPTSFLLPLLLSQKEPSGGFPLCSIDILLLKSGAVSILRIHLSNPNLALLSSRYQANLLVPPRRLDYTLFTPLPGDLPVLHVNLEHTPP